MSDFVINGRAIGPGRAPYLIAEMSGNHNQDFGQARAIVEAAVRAGASAIKLQTYTADTITLDASGPDFRIEDEGSLWSGETLHALYDRAHTEWDWIAELFRLCADLPIDIFSSVFDETAVDFMEELDAPAYKIASFENGHLPLIRSTGMASEDEVAEAVEAARAGGCRQLALLKCTSDYPADPADANLATIPWLRQRFGCEAGLSDHTMGIGVPVAAIALGATIVEKHFTTSRAAEGVDSAFSADEAEFRALVEEGGRAAAAVGGVELGATANEQPSRQFRRSIYAVRDIAAGEALGPHNIRVIRPGYGLHPRHWEALQGRAAPRAYARGERIGPEALPDAR
jgi:N-acetylneuraminate synthase